MNYSHVAIADNAGRRRRLVVLQTHPIQYYAPLYRELARRGDIEIHVIYLTDGGAAAYHDENFGRVIAWDIPLLDGYAYTVMEAGLALNGRGFFSLYSKKLGMILDQLKPDAMLLYGYSSRMNWRALRWAKKNHCRVLYTSDSNASTPRAYWKNLLKKIIVGNFFSKVDEFFCTSEVNENYILSFADSGASINRIPFAIDVRRFASVAPLSGNSQRYDFIWAGKFIGIKMPLDFIRALGLVAARAGVDISASIVGDGPMLTEISESAKQLPTSCQLDFKGFVNQADMPTILQEAHTLIFTSKCEPYGLIATEAAAAGLALVVADGIGCVGDTVLARPGVNALIYPPGDVDALAGAMLQLLINDKLRLDMQQASRSIAAEHDIPVAAAIMESVVNKVCARGGGENMAARVDVASEA